MEAAFQDIKTWLITRNNIHVSDDWLSACLEFIHQETSHNHGSLGSVEQLRSSVFEQWLCSDLSEIGEPSLPPGISDTIKVDLVSSYPLQLLSVADIGSSHYSQKQKLQKNENANVLVSADKSFQPAWEPKPCRMLMIKFTDGHQSVQAIEYQQIKALHTDLLAGTKVAIRGPLLCRRGIMLLKEGNVQVLGGEVDALTESTTPISSLEGLMERNRLDQGKTATLKLSGKFLFRGSNTEKDGLKQKGSFKNENDVAWLKKSSQRPQGGSKSSIQFKPETKFDSQSSGCGKVKMQLEDNKDVQWEDDVDYDALFDDAMNSMDDLPSTSSAVSTSNHTHQRTGPIHHQGQDHTATDVFGPNKASLCFSEMKSDFKQPSVHPTSASAAQPCKVQDPFFDDDLDSYNFDDMDDSFSRCMGNNANHKNIFNVTKKSSSLTSASVTAATKSQNSSNSSSSSYLSNEGSKKKPSPSVIQSCQGSKSQYAKSAISSVQRSSRQSPKREATSSSSQIASSSGASLPKKTRQRKIYEWGIRSPNKPENTNNNSPSSSQDKSNEPFYATSSVDCQVSDKPKMTSLFSDSSSSHPALKYHGDRSVTADKDEVSVSSQSTSSSMEFSSQKRRDLPKAVIHPFQKTDVKANVSVPERPFKYLNDLNLYSPGESITVKAYISTLTDKLRCANGQAWSLSCRINDGTACQDVSLDTEVLTNLIGFTAQESIAMRQDMKSNPSVKDKLMKGLSQCQNKLINMSCLMKIVIPPQGSKPRVTQLTPVTSDHVLKLQQRVTLMQDQ